MIKVGLTGGIGSGKTTVARVFSVLGVPVFSADAEGKRLMAEDTTLAQAILDAFGKQVYTRSTSGRSEEHTSELQSPMRISYAVFCLKKKKKLHILRHLHHVRDDEKQHKIKTHIPGTKLT